MSIESSYNAIDYSAPPSASLVRDRNFKRAYPMHKNNLATDATGAISPFTTIKFDVNPTEYVSGWTSWLHFTVTPESSCFQSQYVHSLADFVESVLLIDRNGLEIERIDGLNLLNSFMVPQKWGKGYMDSSAASTLTGTLYHTPFTAAEDNKTNTPPPNNIYAGTLRDIKWTDRDTATFSNTTTPESYEVNIPLNFLSGIFATDTLLPPHLMLGLEVRIMWANAKDVLVQNINSSAPLVQPFADPLVFQNIYGAEVNPAYTLKDIYIALDSSTLSAQAANQITTMYESGNGIAIKFQTYTRIFQIDVPKTSTSLTLPIEQSFSSATKVLATARIRFSGEEKGIDFKALAPNFLGQPWIDGTSYSLRYNGISYPHDPVQTSVAAYHLWESAFGKNKLYMDVRGPGAFHFMKNMGTTFVVDLNRAPYSFSIAGSAVSTDTNRMASGQRVDGTNPATLQLTLGEVPVSVYAEFRPSSSTPREYRTLSGWMEHDRILVLRADGNRVLV